MVGEMLALSLHQRTWWTPWFTLPFHIDCMAGSRSRHPRWPTAPDIPVPLVQISSSHPSSQPQHSVHQDGHPWSARTTDPAISQRWQAQSTPEKFRPVPLQLQITCQSNLLWQVIWSSEQSTVQSTPGPPEPHPLRLQKTHQDTLYMKHTEPSSQSSPQLQKCSQGSLYMECPLISALASTGFRCPTMVPSAWISSALPGPMPTSASGVLLGCPLQRDP